MMNKAWHLRRDGKSFPIKVHMYCMQDPDLSSEAEVASFMIKSGSADKDISTKVLDVWMGILLEEVAPHNLDAGMIPELLTGQLKSLPYKFPYELTVNEYLDIQRKCDSYTNIDELYEFLDDQREHLKELQDAINRSFNQQFCRVRYGGQYDSSAGNNEIWFRIASTQYNWADTIYKFTILLSKRQTIDAITVCRDSESDIGFENDKVEERIYRAKDGALYLHMPLDEFLQEEHEHSMLFESRDINKGVLYTLRQLLRGGMTYYESLQEMTSLGVPYDRDLWDYLIRREVEAKTVGISCQI